MTDQSSKPAPASQEGRAEELRKLAMQIEKYGTRNADIKLSPEGEADVAAALRFQANALARPSPAGPEQGWTKSVFLPVRLILNEEGTFTLIDAEGASIVSSLVEPYAQAVCAALNAAIPEPGGVREERMRTFTMYRRAVPDATHDANQKNAADEPQFEGVLFSDGTVAIRWLTAKRSTSVWSSLSDMLAIHGHPEYQSELIWSDVPFPPPQDALREALRSSRCWSPVSEAIQSGEETVGYCVDHGHCGCGNKAALDRKGG